jgi:hypothetical protein
MSKDNKSQAAVDGQRTDAELMDDQPESYSNSMRELRVQFKDTFVKGVTTGFATIVVIEVLSVIAMSADFFFVERDAFVLVSIARMLQLSLGIFIGFFTIFLGLLAAWMGIEGSFSGRARTPSASLSLVNGTPGLFLMLSGTIILTVCLAKSVTVTGEASVQHSTHRQKAERSASVPDS